MSIRAVIVTLFVLVAPALAAPAPAAAAEPSVKAEYFGSGSGGALFTRFTRMDFVAELTPVLVPTPRHMVLTYACLSLLAKLLSGRVNG
ncbi:hypothetical protein IAR55_000811 [Kwoniella newhampshirensis]|uniref:Uncharacterized protein n=1 Tax=Kwoniella newhampshirensis TaxID=1651941 RepID=A0AAW0Z3Z1_9TREE